jgi:hypothetical protein
MVTMHDILTKRMCRWDDDLTGRGPPEMRRAVEHPGVFPWVVLFKPRIVYACGDPISNGDA